MKRISTLLFLLIAMFVGTTAWAQTLSVAGVGVDLNATTTQTITGSNIQGKVTYSPSSKTLYLEGATIRGSILGSGLGSSSSDRYYIRLKGANTIVTSSHGMRFDDSYVVLYGAEGSQLYIDSSTSRAGYACIDTEGGHFEVWSIRLSLIGASVGFYGSKSTGTLGFVNSIVTIDCDAGAVQGFKYVSYDDCKFTDEGVKFQSGTGYVDSAGNLVTILHVWPLLVVGHEPVRTAGDSKTGSLYPWKWTKSTKTLEITGDISTLAYTGISNFGIEGLTIKSDGDYTVASSNIGIAFGKNTNFAGSGTLTVTSSTGNGILANADLNVCMKGLSVSAKLHGYTDLHEGHKLTLKQLNNNSDYRFAGANRACLYVSNLEMEDMDIYTRETWWNPTDGYAYFYDEIYKSSSTSSADGCVCFKSTNQISYMGLYVGETCVRAHCSHVISPAVTSGSVTYDATTSTLTLTDVTLTNDGMLGGGIDNRGINGLNVKLVGNNTITTRNSPIASQLTFNIIGDGTLSGTSTGSYGLYLTGSGITCTIDGPQLDIKGTYGVSDYRGTSTLYLKGSTTQVTLDSNGYPDFVPVHNLSNLSLSSNIGILKPSGGWFSSSLKSITIDGSTAYKGKVVIDQVVDYGLIICETPVTSANADDILGDGTFRYDPSTRFLTVTNASVTNTSGSFGSIISNREIRGLGIELVGDNTFTSRFSSIESKQSFYIWGEGTLNCTSTDYAGLFLWPEDEGDIVCYIMGPQVVFSGYWGLYDWTGKSKLFVTGSNKTRVTFKSDNSNYGANYGTIYNLRSLILDEGFNILEPADGWFDTTLKSVTTNGSSAYPGTIVIGAALRGDVNLDGHVDIADAVTVLNAMAGQTVAGDANVNGDDSVDIADFVTVLNIMAGQ